LQMQQAHARGRAGSLGRVTACSGHGIIGMPTRRRERLDDAELSSSTSFSDSVSHVLTGRASAPFVWLISHQPTVLFSQNKPAISTFLSEQISSSHQPPAKRTGCRKPRARSIGPLC
jgi:hypothetical protein